jgi:membrane protein YdbS with pleckstrin-like domain
MTPTLFSSVVKRPRSTYFQGEDPDEEILYILRQSLFVMVPWVFFIIFLLISPIMFNIVFGLLNLSVTGIITPGLLISLNAFWYVFTFGFAFERYLHWFFNVYIITDKRIVDIDFHHMLYKSVSDAPLRNIQDITYDIQGVAESLFNFGDVHIQTAATKSQFDFAKVPDPAKVQDILSDLLKGLGKDER